MSTNNENLTTIMSGFSGVISVTGEGLKRSGSPYGNLFGVGFEVANGVIISTVGTSGNPTQSEIDRAEQIAVDMLVGTISGGLGAMLLAPALVAVGVPSAVAGVVVAGGCAIASSYYGDQIFDHYQAVQYQGFGILDAFLKGDLGPALEQLKDYFDQAAAALPPTSCPVILDLDGDGVETVGLNQSVFFDYDGNGFAEKTAWAGADDGFLVMDRDGNGTIDKGQELFGNQTLLTDGSKAANGFLALAELDSNFDGKVDINDTGWNQLKIWKDIDGNGYSAYSGDCFHSFRSGVSTCSGLAFPTGPERSDAFLTCFYPLSVLESREFFFFLMDSPFRLIL